jgi:Raf kinase inhibitor-like YbhB/YbcL family protein
MDSETDRRSFGGIFEDMRKTLRLRSLICLVVLVSSTGVLRSAIPPAMVMSLTSTAFADGAIIPAKYTRSVENPTSPSLAWGNTPESTASFALIMHDLDMSPQNSLDDVAHWMAFNIPGSARALPEGVPNIPRLPDGTIQCKTLSGTVGYMGPGAREDGPYHHYVFELYALDVTVALGPDASRADLLKAMNGHILRKGVLAGRYHK